MIIWIILGIAGAAVAVSLKYMKKMSSVEDGFTVSGIVLEKKSGKPAADVEVILGNITVNKGENDFIPINGKRVLTAADGKFHFEIEKKGVFWIMAVRNGKKVLKPFSTENGNVEDILLTV